MADQTSSTNKNGIIGIVTSIFATIFAIIAFIFIIGSFTAADGFVNSTITEWKSTFYILSFTMINSDKPDAPAWYIYLGVGIGHLAIASALGYTGFLSFRKRD